MKTYSFDVFTRPSSRRWTRLTLEMFVPPEFATSSSEPELSMVIPHGMEPTETAGSGDRVALYTQASS